MADVQADWPQEAVLMPFSLRNIDVAFHVVLEGASSVAGIAFAKYSKRGSIPVLRVFGSGFK